MMIQTSDGGYAAIGAVYSYGAGNYDFALVRIDANGNYPSCVGVCSPSTSFPSPVTSSPSVGVVWTPTVITQTPTTSIPSPTVTTICATVGSDDADLSGPMPRITCSLIPGDVLFNSPEATAIKIYSADGRLVFLGQLKKGENRINLETGVYLWIAGAYRGKITVK